MAEMIQIDSNTWRIEDDMVRFFLLEGSESALLIDSGMNTPDAKEIAGSLTAKPLRLLNTHADPDHVSGNGAFAEFYMHSAEAGNLLDHGGSAAGLCPVSGGDTLDLGGRPLAIIDLPGHTPGSIAVLDVNARVLFSGDPIQDGNIYMFGARRNMALYIESLTALWDDHRDEFDLVYPSHGSFPVSPAIIPELIAGAKAIMDGRISGDPIDLWGRPIRRCDVSCAGFLCDIDKTQR